MSRSSETTLGSLVERAIKYGIVAVFGEGVRRRNPGAVVNAVFALAATYLPDAVEGLYDVEFRAWQRVYADGAMLAHAVGMLGPYDETWWWDHVTHTLSATLLAGFVHAASDRRGRDPAPRVLAAVVAVGLVWELLEYVIHAVSRRLGIDPILVSYSRKDTLLDLAFNMLGATLVLVFGGALLENFARDPE